MTSPLESALALALEGHPILPLWGGTHVGGGLSACDCGNLKCASPMKHPRGDMVPHGLADASTDPEVIRGWWKRYPNANVGVRTDGMLVLDIDLRRGGDSSYAWLEALDDSPLRLTRRVNTGNGWHEYYLYNAEIVKAGGELLSGIDWKAGSKAYVVGPGSLHASGRIYEANDTPLAPVHPSIIARIERASTKGEGNGPAAYATEKVAEGGRNDFLKSAAGYLRNIATSGDEMVALLEAVNQQRCDPPYPPDRIREFAMWAMNREGGTASLSPALITAEPGAVDRLRQRIWGVDRLRDQPSPEWDVAGILVEKSLAVLYGEGGSYKSFLALDWALCRASGETWHGHKVTPGKTLYIASEGVSAYGKRVKAWLYKHAGDWSDIEERFKVFPRAINLLTNPEEGAALIDVLREDEYTHLVVDTLRKAMSGGDENHTKDVGRVFEILERAKHEAGVATLVIHHAAKGSDGAKGRFRGSSMIHDDSDAVFRMTKVDVPPGSCASASLSCEKQKDVEEFAPFSLALKTDKPDGSLYIDSAVQGRELKGM